MLVLQKKSGFSLTELLVGVLLLGVIASFTIPKVLTNQKNQQRNSFTKEAMVTLTDMMAVYKGALKTSTGMEQLRQGLNAHRTTEAKFIEGNANLLNCSMPQFACLQLPNGTAMGYTLPSRFGGTKPNNAILIYFDPDGLSNSHVGIGPYDGVNLYLYTDGIVRVGGTNSLRPNTRICLNNGQCITANNTMPYDTKPKWLKLDF